MTKPLATVLIANRGKIAVRDTRTCKDADIGSGLQAEAGTVTDGAVICGIVDC